MKTIRALSVLAVLAALVVTPFGSTFENVANAQFQGLSPLPESLPFVTKASGSGLDCRVATREEARALTRRSGVERHIIPSPPQPNPNSLNIILRATPQLDQFPVAKAAFLRAAARWEELIETPITIVIDVDFGPTFFGTPFPPFVLGATDAQTLASAGIYDFVRFDLAAGADNVQERLLYNQFPVGTIPTDLGQTNIMASPSAGFRALGLINPVADPGGEEPFFGPPPAIGFNSAFSFDFDPSDGVDENKIDFDAVAVHEIGHVLGFASDVGFSELIPGFPPVPTVLDLFRFRPNVNLSSFGGEERILSSGGQQVFFAISPQLQFSTGRPDGSGGDGAQASHWKFVVVNPNQPPIGIMVPFINFGERQVITQNDLRAFDAIGYTLKK